MGELRLVIFGAEGICMVGWVGGEVRELRIVPSSSEKLAFAT